MSLSVVDIQKLLEQAEAAVKGSESTQAKRKRLLDAMHRTINGTNNAKEDHACYQFLINSSNKYVKMMDEHRYGGSGHTDSFQTLLNTLSQRTISHLYSEYGVSLGIGSEEIDLGVAEVEMVGEAGHARTRDSNLGFWVQTAASITDATAKKQFILNSIKENNDVVVLLTLSNILLHHKLLNALLFSFSILKGGSALNSFGEEVMKSINEKIIEEAFKGYTVAEEALAGDGAQVQQDALLAASLQAQERESKKQAADDYQAREYEMKEAEADYQGEYERKERVADFHDLLPDGGLVTYPYPVVPIEVYAQPSAYAPPYSYSKPVAGMTAPSAHRSGSPYQAPTASAATRPALPESELEQLLTTQEVLQALDPAERDTKQMKEIESRLSSLFQQDAADDASFAGEGQSLYVLPPLAPGFADYATPAVFSSSSQVPAARTFPAPSQYSVSSSSSTGFSDSQVPAQLLPSAPLSLPTPTLPAKQGLVKDVDFFHRLYAGKLQNPDALFARIDALEHPSTVPTVEDQNELTALRSITESQFS